MEWHTSARAPTYKRTLSIHYLPSPPYFTMPSAVRQSFAELLVPEADDLGRLTKGEIWWRNCVRWLELVPYAGYVLPPRFRQDWRPSWKEHPKRHPSEFEDWYRYEVRTDRGGEILSGVNEY